MQPTEYNVIFTMLRADMVEVTTVRTQLSWNNTIFLLLDMHSESQIVAITRQNFTYYSCTKMQETMSHRCQIILTRIIRLVLTIQNFSCSFYVSRSPTH